MQSLSQLMKTKFTSVLKVLVCLTVVTVLWLMLSPRREPATSHSGSKAVAASASDAIKSDVAPATPANTQIASSAATKPPTSPTPVPADIYEQIRAAQRWFAYAGNDSNGSPRLIASVPAQKFAFVAEQSGVEVKPWSETNWSWRMESIDGGNAAPIAEHGRATYARGSGVTEWFENGEHGVEQGFTLEVANGETIRRMPLRVTTELQPRLRPQADGVDFVDASGNAQLHYDGLIAFDAEGKQLKSWIEIGQSIRPVRNPNGVESSSPGLRETSYPGKTDLISDNPNGVASYSDQSRRNPVGVENPPAHDSQGNSSLATLGFGSESRWDSHHLTLAVDTTGAKFPVTIDPVISLGSERIAHPQLTAGDLFGSTVAAHGNLIAIGAPKHQVSAVPNAGVVYLFIRDNNCDEEWTLLQTLPAPNPYNNGQFGRSLSLGNGALAVSAHRLTVSGGGGDVLEDVVHVFQPSLTNSSVWIQRATFKESDPNVPTNPTNYFGYSLSVNPQGTMLAIGSPLSWSEGGQFPFRTGKIFVHGRDVGGAQNWGLIRNLQPPLYVPNAGYGRAVAMDGSRIAVGAPGYFLSNTNGSVFVYEYHSSGSLELPAPTLPGNVSMEGFGERLAYSGNQLAVAAPIGGKAVVVYERQLDHNPNTGLTTISFHPGILYAPNPYPGSFNPGKDFGSVISLNSGTLAVGWNSGQIFIGDDDEPVPATGLDMLVRYEHQGNSHPDPALNWKTEAPIPATALSLRGIANVAVAGNLLVTTSTNENYGGTNFNFGAAVAMRKMGGTWVATQRFSAGLPLASNDLAGTSIAVSDDLLVVGAPGYDVAGTVDSGAVHVFRRFSGLPPSSNTLAHGWILAATIVNEVPQANGRLGESVAVADDLVVAGAPGRNNSGGTVWVWQRASEVATAWAGHVVLGAPGGALGWRFGSAVSFNGSTLAVGSPLAGAGRAHLFHRGTTNDWPVLQTLLPHANDARFGAALDLDEADNLIVGAPDASVNGPQSGEAYIYRRANPTNAPIWIEEADPGSFVSNGHAGTSVAIDRGWAFVGAPGEPVGTNRTGRVRVFRRTFGGGPWDPAATLEPPVSSAGVGQFGSAISIDEHTAVIGAGGGSTNTAGAAFVYTRVAGATGEWRYTAKLLDPCSAAGDGFGSSIALVHDKIFVGVPKANLTGGNAGTVVLFERSGATWSLLREVPQDSNHRLGSSVAVSGDWMVIGSTGDWDEDVEGVSDAGQVYVLRRHDPTNGVWQVVNKVVRPLPIGGTYDPGEDDFGRAVDISDRVFVVGSHAGVHTFELLADGQVAHLGQLRASMDDIDFGRAVAIHGQRIAIVALHSVAFFVRTNEHTDPLGEFSIQTHWDREARKASGYCAAVDLSDTTAVVGSPSDISVSGSVWGTVSVFERDQGGLGNWGPTAYFTDPDIFGDELFLPAFGTSVALDGDTLVVGTWFPDQRGSGESGMGTVFQRHAGGLNQWGKVGEVGGPFVAVSGDWVLSGINTPRREENPVGDGSFRHAELYHRNAGGPDQWGVVQTFSAPNTNRTHTWNYGRSVALDGSTLVVGAPGELRSASDWTPGRAFIYDISLNSLQIWKDTHFAEQYFGPLPPNNSPATASLGDADNDGVLNAWEAYHGLNPLLNDAPLAGLKAQGITAGEFVLRWREGIDPQGLSVSLQWSRTLGDWFNSGQGPTVNDTKTFTITTVQTNADHILKEARVPVGGDGQLYTRLVLQGL
jgi:hypothetical protein